MKLKNLLIVLILGIGMVACSPSKSEQNRVVSSYMQQTTIYQFHTVYRSSAGIDSVDVYIAAQDKYNAERLYDKFMKESNSELKMVSMAQKEIVLTNHQFYPYE